MTKKQVLKRLEKYCNCKVQPSGVDGVGLFAIKDIAKGTSIFGSPQVERGKVHFFTHNELKKLPEETRELIYHYHFSTKTGLHLPDFAENYHHLAVYLNHSEDFNCKFVFDMGEIFTTRDVKQGEELLCNLEENIKDTGYYLKFFE
jgi:SET domain-containing protein